MTKINKELFDELCDIEACGPYSKDAPEIERYKEIVKLFKKQEHIQVTDAGVWSFKEKEVERIYNIAVIGIAVDCGKTYICKT